MKSRTSAAKKQDFNPRILLSTIGKGRSTRAIAKGHKIYSQGDASDGLFYIQLGHVQLSVVSEAGRKQFSVFSGKATSLAKGASRAKRYACARRRP